MTLVTQSVMRERFYETAGELVDRHDRVAVVIAEIGVPERRDRPGLEHVRAR